MRKRRLLVPALLLSALTLWSSLTLQLQELPLPVAALPDGLVGVRIVLLTDLHGRSFGRENCRLLRAVERAEPDLIAVCGDLADSRTTVAELEPTVRGLCRKAPVFFVTGNHEWDGVDTHLLLEELTRWGVTVLRNAYVLLANGEDRLVLAGAEDPNGPAGMETPQQLVHRIRREQGEAVPLLVLYHRNDALAQWAELEVDAVLSGHGHGGVVRLPLVGGLVGTDRSLFPPFTDGLYTAGKTTMAVSRGLGGARLWNRPHLPVLVLEKQ